MIAGIASAFARHIAEKIKLKAYAAVLYVGAGVVLLFAIAFALVGLRHWLIATYGLRYPELWIALALLVIALIIGAIGLAMQRRQPKTNPLADLALVAGPPAARLAARRVDLPVVMTGVVLVLGVVLGRRLTRPSS